MPSIEQIRTRAQVEKLKFPPRHPFYNIHRLWSAYITAVLLQCKVPAITISAFMIGFGVAGLVLIATSHVLAGVGLTYLSFLTDKCDGEIARYSCNVTPKGIYIDELYHMLINPLIFAAVGTCLSGTHASLICGLIASYLYLLVRSEYKAIYSVAMKSRVTLGSRVDLLAQGNMARVLRWFSMLAAEDIVLIACLIFYLFGGLPAFLWTYIVVLGSLFVINAIYSYYIGTDERLSQARAR